MTIKFVEEIIFSVAIKVPHRGGMSADVADILQAVSQGENTLMVQDEKGFADGWSIHVISPEGTDGSMLDLSEETPREALQEYLLGLPEGAGVAVSLVLDRGEYTSTKLYRRTVDGFVLTMRTSTDAREGFSLEVF